MVYYVLYGGRRKTELDAYIEETPEDSTNAILLLRDSRIVYYESQPGIWCILGKLSITTSSVIYGCVDG